VVRIIDTKTNKSVTLRSGVYELELKGAPEGLKLDIKEATLVRGKTEIARIVRTGVPKGEDKPRVKADPPIIEPLHRIRSPWGTSCYVYLSPDNRYFTAGLNGRMGARGARVWHLKTGELFRELPGEVGGYPRFTPDGKHVITINHLGIMTLYDLEADKVVRRFGTPVTDRWWGLGNISESGNRVVRLTHP